MNKQIRKVLTIVAMNTICALAQNAALCQPSRHVILISIDGFRPDMYQDKSWPAPNLQQLMKRGT